MFSAAPDSIAKCGEWKGRSGWRDMVWLVWLVWLFGPLFLDFRFEHWLWPTLASIPVFLLLYWRGRVCPRRQVAGYAIAVVVVGAAVTPFNPFAQTYLVFGCALAAGWESPRRSGTLVLAMLAAYSIEWFVLRYPWESIVNAWILCPIISGLIITERIERRHRADLRLSHEEVRRLAASAERERIGRDLHDLLGHTLSMVALKSELAGRLLGRDPGAARREIAEVERVAREALAQVRHAVRGIRSAALASELASAHLLLEAAGVEMEYWRDPQPLPGEVETCLALVLREAVTNVQRHARAGRVEVSVIAGPERVVMRVRDDGRGGADLRGNGLAGMDERVRAMGGAFLIESVPGCGTSIEVSLPLAAVPRAEHAPRGPDAASAAPQLKLADGGR